MKLRLTDIWQSLRASYWFLPTLLAASAVLLATITLRVDRILTAERANGLAWLYRGGASGARDLLAAIAGSTITVAGTTFSITIAVLQLTSVQFGPRLLRTFMRDTANQAVLGTFTATFLYCLLVLRQVRGLDNVQFVPHLSVTVGIALGVMSVAVLIYFIHHIASSIQAANVIATTSRELEHAIAQLFPETIGRGEEAAETPPAAEVLPAAFERESSVLPSTRSGYIEALDSDRLVALAREHDLILRLIHRPGDFVVAGAPLVVVWPPDRASETLRAAVNHAFVLGNERSPVQDAAFPVNQLVEIAVRALSPGTNDPFTAITCIDRLSAGLCKLAGRDFPSPYRYDDDNTLRLIAEPATFASLVDAAFDQIRQYGATSVAVTLRLLEAIARVAGCARTEEQRLVLARHAEMVHRAGERHITEPFDRAALEERYQAARAALGLTGTTSTTSTPGWLRAP